jgi:hypothetical protein
MGLLVLASLMVLQSSIVPANLPRDISADDFNQLFHQLNSNLFSQREAAQKRLTDLATNAQLTGAQLQAIQGAIGGRDLEVSRRATEIFGAFVESLPSYQNLVKAAQVQLTRPVLFNPTIVDDNTTQIGKFRFGDATGSFFSPGTTSYGAFTSLSDSWLPVQKALVVGNIAEARQALRNFRMTMNMLTDVEIVNLDIEDAGGRALRRNDLLARIDAAIPELVSFQFDLLNGGARDDSGLPVPMPIRNAGLVSLGQSLALNLGLIVSPSSVALFGPDSQSARSLPPSGFEFVGHIFDLQAQDGLLIGGSIGIDIEFGDVQLVGNPVHDPRRLQIVRIANGQDFFLPTILIDTERVSGAYSLDPSSMAGDQFGEFALVQAVPEPATLVLAAAGLLLLLCTTVLPSSKARGGDSTVVC